MQPDERYYDWEINTLPGCARASGPSGVNNNSKVRPGLQHTPTSTNSKVIGYARVQDDNLPTGEKQRFLEATPVSTSQVEDGHSITISGSVQS